MDDVDDDAADDDDDVEEDDASAPTMMLRMMLSEEKKKDPEVLNQISRSHLYTSTDIHTHPHIRTHPSISINIHQPPSPIYLATIHTHLTPISQVHTYIHIHTSIQPKSNTHSLTSIHLHTHQLINTISIPTHPLTLMSIGHVSASRPDQSPQLGEGAKRRKRIRDH
jgi:hypothetical protein